MSLRTRTTSWATSTAFARLHEKHSSIVFLSLRPLCSFASLSRRRLVGSRRTARGKANKRDTELDSNHARGKKHSFCPLLAKNSPPDCFLNAVTPANLSDAGVGESTGKANKRDTASVSFRTRTTSGAFSVAPAYGR